MGVFLTGLTFVFVFKNICKCRFKKIYIYYCEDYSTDIKVQK